MPVKGKDGDAKKLAARRRAVVRVKTANKRSVSSKNWLERQLNDPYVAAAKEAGYRSRAAFKLLQLDEEFKLLKKGQAVIDLGAAPGGWTQIATSKIGASGKLVAIDILPMEPIANAILIHLDFLSDEAPRILTEKLGGKADLVLSDMAPSTTGHSPTDHLRIMAMAEMAADFAITLLKPGGAFVCKLFQGGAEKDLLNMLKLNFTKVRHAKPAASRAESSESYIVAMGFRGG